MKHLQKTLSAAAILTALLCACNDAEPKPIYPATFDLDLSRLSPGLRESLEAIRVFVLTDDNVDAIWDLEESDLADVVILACSQSSLSNDVLDLLDSWSSKGKGLLIGGHAVNAAWSRFFPDGYYAQVADSVYNPQVASSGGPVIENVSNVRNVLWCSLSDDFLQIYSRSNYPPDRYLHEELSHSDIGEIFEGETFYPVLVQALDDWRGEDYDPLILFVNTRGRARIAWYVNKLDPGKEACVPMGDDARLWSNLIYWLARG